MLNTQKYCSLILFAVIVLSSIKINGQARSFSTPTILSPDTPFAHSATDLNHTQDYQEILVIYNKLINARGDFRYAIPKLYLREEEGYVASIDYDDISITIEKKAYDICKKFGDKAVAFLLAHELTHYYEKHAWKSDFVSELKGLTVASDLRKIQDKVFNETQADYLGGFLAYSAGFGLFDKGASIIDGLYAGYNRPEILQDYPSKTDRIKMADLSAEKINRLVEVFEMANYMSILGKYRKAFQYYKNLLLQYQSREIYNNAGTTAVLEAITLFNKDSLKFQYVAEYDLKFKGSRSVKSTRDSLLRIAIPYFEAATNLDPDYAPGYLNKANAYALLNEDKKAMFYLEFEALPALARSKTPFPKTLSDINNLLGILQAKAGKTTEASAFFDKAILDHNEAANFNKNAMLGIPNNNTLPTLNINSIDGDSIGSISLNSYYKRPAVNTKNLIKLDKNNTFFQNIGADFKIYMHQTENEDNQTTRQVFLMTPEGYKGKTKLNIAIGNSDTAIKSAYGKPKEILQSVQGKILVYPEIIFLMDEKDTLIKWVYYTSRIVII